MNPIVKFFHHLFTPHCEHCHTIELENKVCQSCDMLRQENHRMSLENTRLLDAIILKNLPALESPVSHESIKPVNTAIPFRVKRQMLEAESRAQKRILDERIKEIEKEVYQIPIEQLVPTTAPTSIADDSPKDDVVHEVFEDNSERETVNGL